MFKIILSVVGFIVACYLVWLMLSIALAPITIANKAVNSATNIVTKTIDADNVLHNYEWFYDTNAAYESRLAQINSYKNIVTEETAGSEKQALRMELAAMQQSCRDLATKYNANSQKLNRKIFKANSLPFTLDIACGD